MKKTIKDFDLKDKKILMRCDFNVPMENNRILDDTRIKSSLKTINYVIDNGGKLILFSHLGKVKEESDKKNNSLLPVKICLESLLEKKVLFSNSYMGKELEDKVNSLNSGDILLIENTRYADLDNKKESNCDLELAKYWASLGNIFINDAYGTLHRKHASNYGIASYLPNGIGFLVEDEVTKIDSFLSEDTNPFIIVMGGKKVEDKIPLIEALIDKCDNLLIGGGMSYTFLKALGNNVGNSIVDENSIDFCKNMLSKYQDKIVLPIDFIVDDNSNIKNILLEEFNNETSYDIGPKTVELFSSYLEKAKRVIINGPMGVFEQKEYENGTKGIYEVLSKNNIKTLIGGGDSASSVNKLGFDNSFYHISTGGGATLEYLSGKVLPGLDIIENK